jgi:Kef-type K+ transport system membrane component KefB
VASINSPSVAGAAALVAITCGIGLAAGVVGWLLIERAHSEAERGLFVIGVLAFAGGAASYLGVSPLLTGLVTGIVWRWTPGRVDAIVRQDVRRYQHPLVVLVLLVAGASVLPSVEAVWLLAPFVLLRVAGKLAGGWLATRLAPSLAPGDLGAHLLAPGLIGIAFALAAARALGAVEGTPLLTAVVTGTLVSEVIALSVAPATYVGTVEEPR